jgi:hypothetical protein
VTHVPLALIKLARRTTLRLQAWELIQIALGLFVPLLLPPHIVNKAVTHWPDRAASEALELYRWIVRFAFAGTLIIVAVWMDARWIA